MAQAFGSGGLGPANIGVIVVEYFNRGGCGEEDRGSGCVFDDVLEAKNGFNTFICGIHFGFH